MRVQFPNIVETFQRAWHEVVAPFLSSGNSFGMNGQNVSFYNCELVYNLDFFKDGDAKTKPFIVMAGTRSAQATMEKCEDPRAMREHGYEFRQRVFRTIYAGIGRSFLLNPPPYVLPAEERKATFQDAEAIWSQLAFLLEHQHAAFRERGIYSPKIPFVPAHQPHQDYCLVRGELIVEVRAVMTRGD